jgi:hypothetical protein
MFDPSCGLMFLFFASYDSFRIVNGTLFLAKDGSNTSVQLLSKN